MRAAFLVTLAVLIGLTVVAWRIQPEPSTSRVQLVWSTDNNPTRQGQIALFNKLNPDIEVVVDPNNTDQQKVIVQSLGGVGPDLFDSYGLSTMEAYVRSGIAMDITEPMREAGIDVAKIIWPVAVSSCVYEGRTYGFPCNVNANAVWYNKDLFDRAGIPYPKPGWTWDELIETAKKLTIRDRRGRAQQFGFYWDWQYWTQRNDLIYQFGGRFFTPDGTRCTIGSEGAIAAMQLSRDLQYKHKICPTPVEEAALTTQGGWGTGGITYLMGGRVAMAYGGRWWLNLFRKEKPDLRLGAVMLPFARDRVLIGGARCTFVNKNSPKREAALRFIKFLASEEYNLLLNDQADALSPVMKYCYTDRFLHNPQYPNEDYNHVWREAVAISIPDEYTPFLRGPDLSTIGTQIDLIRVDQKPVAQAMRDAERDANERILRNVRLRPGLGQRYFELTGRRP